MTTALFKKLSPIRESLIVKNSFWGLTSNLVQNLFLSLFFLIMARQYSTNNFAQYLIANSLYQFVAAFSALGLGQWFMREIVQTTDKEELIHRFLKMQFCFGIMFFFINVLLGFILYDSYTIRVLSVLLGLNVIFDNLIYSVKHVNIAEYTQKNTFLVLAIEAVSKFLIGCLLFLYPLSIITLSLILIILRFITLNLFLRLSSTGGINLNQFWETPIIFKHVRKLVLNNWPFIVIGSISIIYWRIGGIIVSKMLPLIDVANYEISVKLFTMAQLLPVIVSATVFPTLTKLYNQDRKVEFRLLYRKVFTLYFLFGLFSYTFIYSFSDFLLPFAFGGSYSETAVYTKQMFLTILVFPTALLQANILVAIKMEKLDMYFNILSLLLNVTICFIGLYYIQSLLVINLSIFISFIIFHLSQDFVLLRRKIVSFSHTLFFYLFSVVVVISYTYAHIYMHSVILFVLYWIIIGLILLIKLKNSGSLSLKELFK
jgi:O-antigen/teichoic acid export membrane protein